MKTATTPTAADIQAELRLLYIERALAELQGLASDAAYMADLSMTSASTGARSWARS
jgi:hypothetical protein